MSLESPTAINVLADRVADVFPRMKVEDRWVPLLPLLEHPYPEVKEKAEEVFRSRGLISSTEPFPFAALVGYGLCSHSEHWIRRAVQWIEDGFPLSDPIKQKMRSVCDERQLPQSLRHSAWRLIHNGGQRGGSDNVG